MKTEKMRFIRYPGGKQRILSFMIDYLPLKQNITGKFIEPFVGSGAVFFALNPKKSVLNDINNDLIILYRGIRRHPEDVWKIYKKFPSNKIGYYKIRDEELKNKSLAYKAARILYLNRTCFKGMWRHNSNGEFNIGYGGQDRRWVISKKDLIDISRRLKKAKLNCSDFEEVIDKSGKGDFLFCDPPYRPGEVDMTNTHYNFNDFSYDDHKRLARALKRSTKRGVDWALTISSHPKILRLYKDHNVVVLPKGTGKKPGELTNKSGEVLILNYREE